MNPKEVYEQIRENDDYILINRATVYHLLSYDLEQEIIEEVKDITMALDEEIGKSYINKLAIRKDSLVGDTLSKYGINKDDYITHDHIASALLVAICEENIKLTNKLMPLLKGRVSGWKNELDDIPEYLLEYIIENNDYHRYLSEVDGTPSKEYYVYEDKEIERRDLSFSEVRTKK